MPTIPKRKIKFLPVASVLGINVTENYITIGSPTSAPVLSLLITNDLNTCALISIDGVNDHILTVGSTAITLDFSSKQNIGRLQLPVGTQFYIKTGSGRRITSGSLFISFIYAG